VTLTGHGNNVFEFCQRHKLSPFRSTMMPRPIG
jgi:hypothetical protein